MILLRKMFASSNKEKRFGKEEDKEKKIDKDKALAIGGVGTGGFILSKTKPGRLTGKVVRWHDAPTEVIDKIKEEGLKAKYAEDPDNLTNKVLQDIPMEKKKGLVYTSKKKGSAFGVGSQRSLMKGEIDNIGQLKELLFRRSKHHKPIKLEFDYDELKDSPRIENPELRGAKSVKEFYEARRKSMGADAVGFPGWDDLDPVTKSKFKSVYKQLGEDTHIFKGDVDPSHIVGGKGYKKRTMKQVVNYIKNNPKRFGKEAAKVATGAALLGYGTKKAVDYLKKNKEDKKSKK